jgi:signal peptide peptidase SppA
VNPFLARLHNQQALIEEGRAAWLESALAKVSERMGEIEKATAGNEDFWSSDVSWLRPYVVRNGILFVPVKGVLLNDFPYAFFDWATGYEYIWEAVKRGLDDTAVKGIALVIDSGGGMISGNFDLVDRLFDARGQKPIRAFAAEHAYSAAYNIASAADHVTVARTGGVGSIGVITIQVEMSRALDAAGITVNLIRSKPDKMEGNSYEPLSDGARERIQERVTTFHNQFVAMVARNRGMEAKAVDDTDAHTFMAQQAIENGLADEIGALDDAITAFEATFSEGEDDMAEYTQAAYDEGIALATAAGIEKGKKEGAAEGVAAERTRISGILGHDNAKERPKAALAAALDTEMSVEQAGKFLGNLNAETAPDTGVGAPKGMLKSAMKGSENPEVGAEGGGDDPKELTRAEKTRAMMGRA